MTTITTAAGGRLTIERDIPDIYMEYESKSKHLYQLVRRCSSSSSSSSYYYYYYYYY